MGRSLRLALALFGLGAGACDHWPGVDDNAPNSGFPIGNTGTCSGTPLPCGALAGGDCGSTPGCMDQGACMGTSTMFGQPCSTALSFQACGAIAGCFWSSNCLGTPLGTCNGSTEATCLLAKGCVFTAGGAGGGVAGSSTVCSTYGQSCTSAANCDCGFACVQQCASCRATCGTPCLSDGDCTGTTGSFGTTTPYCVGVPSPLAATFTGVCASSR